MREKMLKFASSAANFLFERILQSKFSFQTDKLPSFFNFLPQSLSSSFSYIENLSALFVIPTVFSLIESFILSMNWLERIERKSNLHF